MHLDNTKKHTIYSNLDVYVNHLLSLGGFVEKLGKIIQMRQKLLLVILLTPLTILSQEVSKIGIGEDDSLIIVDMSGLSHTTLYSDYKSDKLLDSLARKGEYEKAIEYLSFLINSDSLNPNLYYYRANFKSMIYYNDTSCLDDYRKAISIDSNYLEAHYGIGVKYIDLLDYEDDSDIFNVKKDSTVFKYSDHYVYGSIYHLEKVLELDSTEFFNLKNTLYNLYYTIGDFDKADKIQNLNYRMPDKTDSLNIPINPKTYYFPIEYVLDTINLYFSEEISEEFIEDRISLAHFRNSWYSMHLFALKEPLLYNNYFNDEIYRFTWLRTFDEPIIIRIMHYEDKNQLVVKMSNGTGGYNPGDLVLNKTVNIEPNQWNKFISIVNNIDFWNLSSIEQTNVIGFDGARWILEGVKDGIYHMVDRWSDSEIVEACLYLLTLSKLEIDKVY